MKTVCQLRRLVMYGVLLNLEAYMTTYTFIYFSERSTVLLKGPHREEGEWKGPAYNRSYNEISLHGHLGTWNVTAYTFNKSIIPNLPHKLRLKVIKSKNSYEFDLQIINASVMDEGLYFCKVTLYQFVSHRYILKMIKKPVVSSMCDMIEEINEGETKKLCCFVDSNAATTSTKWLNGSQEIFFTHNVKETCYTIENASRYDNGNYTCIAENINGNGSVSVVLKVNYKPDVSIVHDIIEDITEGETKKLCCFVDSNPTPTSTKWLNGAKEIFVTHYINKTCYTINNVNRFDQGNYTCIADNYIGNGSVSIILKVKYKPEVSSIHGVKEEIKEGVTKKRCCYVDSNPPPTSTRWLNGSRELLVTHSLVKTCYTTQNVTRYDEGNYTCIAHNTIGNGSITTVLRFKSNYSLKEQTQSLQIIVLVALLGTIAVLVVGIGILFFHLKRKNKQRIISTINHVTTRGNGGESGHYMEIYMIDENIVAPLQENSNPNVSTVERTFVENRGTALTSAGHSSTSSDEDTKVLCIWTMAMSMHTTHCWQILLLKTNMFIALRIIQQTMKTQLLLRTLIADVHMK